MAGYQSKYNVHHVTPGHPFIQQGFHPYQRPAHIRIKGDGSPLSLSSSVFLNIWLFKLLSDLLTLILVYPVIYSLLPDRRDVLYRESENLVGTLDCFIREEDFWLHAWWGLTADGQLQFRRSYRFLTLWANTPPTHPPYWPCGRAAALVWQSHWPPLLLRGFSGELL